MAIIDGPSYRWLFDHEAAVRDMTIRALSTVVFRLMLALEEVLVTRRRGRVVIHDPKRLDAWARAS